MRATDIPIPRDLAVVFRNARNEREIVFNGQRISHDEMSSAQLIEMGEDPVYTVPQGHCHLFCYVKTKSVRLAQAGDKIPWHEGELGHLIPKEKLREFLENFRFPW